MQRLVSWVALLLLALAAPPALAASGTALGVKPAASLEARSGSKTLVVGTDIFIGDRVVTDAKGVVQIKFSDKTELVVGPRSSLVIEDYLLREDGSGGKFAINALAGTFRFTTGGARKDLYAIKTPTGTIGVRGTAFDFDVTPAATSLLLFHGVVVMCNTAGKCVTVDKFCDVGAVDPSEAKLIGNTDQITGNQRNALRGMFPYAVSEADLLSAFRIDHARECLNRRVIPVVQDPVTETSEPQQPGIRPGNGSGPDNGPP